MFLRLRRKTTDKSLVLVNCGAYQFKISSFYLELAGAWDTLLSFIFAAQKPDLSLITRKCARHNYTDINYLVNMLDKTPPCNENVSRAASGGGPVWQVRSWWPINCPIYRTVGHPRPPAITTGDQSRGRSWKCSFDYLENYFRCKLKFHVCMCVWSVVTLLPARTSWVWQSYTETHTGSLSWVVPAFTSLLTCAGDTDWLSPPTIDRHYFWNIDM